MRSFQLLRAGQRLRNNPQSGDLPEQNPVIAGYRVGDLLGQGPLGKVYRAENVATGQKVVFRGFARPEEAGAPGALLTWEQAKNQFRELLAMHQRMADQPDAPSTIQKVIAFGEESELFWIATEFFEGKTLRSVLDNEPSLPFVRIVDIFRQIAQAVDYMGQHGLAHTDLTPFNILLVSEPGASANKYHVEVINFGLAHARSKFGSPYAAPEQQQGIEGDLRSDVYAVGAMLYEVLTGRTPFTAETAEEMAQKILYSFAEPVANRPGPVQEILGGMLAKQATARYGTVREAIEDLAANRSPRFPVQPLMYIPSGYTAPSAAPESVVADAASPVGYTPPPPHAPAVYTPAPPATPAGPASAGDAFAISYHPGGGVPVPAEPVRRPEKPEITLQNYKLADQDILVIRWRQEQEKRKAQELRAERWDRFGRWVRLGGLVVVLGLLFVWASSWRTGFRYVTVLEVQGDVRLVEGKSAHALRVGEQIYTERHPIIVTKQGNVTLGMPESRLYLPANSALGLLRLDYKGGVVRNLELQHGSVVGYIDPDRRIARYDVRASDTITRVKGPMFFVTLTNGMLAAGTKQGDVQVRSGGEKQSTRDGVLIVAQNNAPPEPAAATPFVPLVAQGEKALAKAKDDSPLTAVANAQEVIVAPVVSIGDTLLKLPVQANDQKNMGLAMASMQALATLLMTADSGEGLPTTIDPTTLKELGMEAKDRQRLLDQFYQKRILSYRRLPNGGYELYARVNDSEHTLLRASNGRVETLENQEAP